VEGVTTLVNLVAAVGGVDVVPESMLELLNDFGMIAVVTMNHQRFSCINIIFTL